MKRHWSLPRCIAAAASEPPAAPASLPKLSLPAGVCKLKGETEYDWDPSTRRDTVLVDTLVARGVPRGNIVTLLDDAATLKDVTAALQRQCEAAAADETFIFYYDGETPPPMQCLEHPLHPVRPRAPPVCASVCVCTCRPRHARRGGEKRGLPAAVRL